MKTVGIVTFAFANNYGAELQSYGLKYYLDSLPEVKGEIINYRSYVMTAGEIFYLRNAFYHPKTFLRMLIHWRLYRRKNQKFINFQKNELEVTCFHNRKEVILKNQPYQTIIFGSDQIWNLQISHDDLFFWGEGFREDIHKVAYAASAGSLSTFHLYNNEKLFELLYQFDAISCRENTLTQFLLRNGIKAQDAVDPVFLLNKNEWKELEAKVVVPEKYILFYGLEENPALFNVACSIGEKNNLPILEVHPSGTHLGLGKYLQGIGPKEFLFLVDHAECIITNSFHGFAFSVIFHKKVYLAIHSKTGERIESLMSLIGVESRNNPEVVYEIDPSQISREKLDELIIKSKDFLRKNIGLAEQE